LRWLRLAKQAQETSAPSWTHQAPLGQATPRRLTDKARPSNVRLLAKIYSSIEADALTLGRSSCWLASRSAKGTSTNERRKWASPSRSKWEAKAPGVISKSR